MSGVYDNSIEWTLFRTGRHIAFRREAKPNFAGPILLAIMKGIDLSYSLYIPRLRAVGFRFTTFISHIYMKAFVPENILSNANIPLRKQYCEFNACEEYRGECSAIGHFE